MPSRLRLGGYAVRLREGALAVGQLDTRADIVLVAADAVRGRLAGAWSGPREHLAARADENHLRTGLRRPHAQRLRGHCDPSEAYAGGSIEPALGERVADRRLARVLREDLDPAAPGARRRIAVRPM